MILRKRYSMFYVFLLGWIHFAVCRDLSATDPEYLYEATRGALSLIRDYVEKERQRLDQLIEIARNIEDRSVIQAQSFQRDADIISTFTRVSDLLVDYQLAEYLMSTAEAQRGKEMLWKSAWESSRLPLPEADLTAVATAVMRIQDVLTVEADTFEHELAKLTPMQNNTSTRLTARHCFEIGRVALIQYDYYHALDWLLDSQARLDSENPPTVDEQQVMSHLSLALRHQGNEELAQVALERWKNISVQIANITTFTKSFDDCADIAYDIPKPFLQSFCSDAISEGALHADVPPVDIPLVKNPKDIIRKIPGEDEYIRLCRDGLLEECETCERALGNTKQSTHLHCFYRRDGFYLSLAPVKVEIISIKPKVQILHDIISDKEIATVQRLAMEKLAPSVVVEGNENVVSKVRTSSTAWLFDLDDDVVHNVRRRLGLATGLSLETAEGLQVTRYGIGGNYLPHYDFARDDEIAVHGYHGFYQPYNGNRIATALLYLSAPETGGATAFPLANVKVQPQKNGAVFWHNLKTDGRGDTSTYHAGCPVLSGVKWVANLWFHERGQEFRRPCQLTMDD